MGVKPDVLCPQSPCERAGWRGHRGPPACGVDVSCPRALFVQGKGGQGRLGSTFYELCPLITGEVNAHSGLPGSPPSAGKARPREWRTCPSSPDSPTDVEGGVDSSPALESELCPQGGPCPGWKRHHQGPQAGGGQQLCSAQAGTGQAGQAWVGPAWAHWGQLCGRAWVSLFASSDGE